MKLQFYSEKMNGEYAPVLILADAEGRGAIAFNASFDVGKLKLPTFRRNFFPLYPGPLNMTEKHYMAAETCKEELFSLVSELMDISDHATFKEGRAVFNAFFLNKCRAWAMLEKLKAEVAERRLGEDAYNRLVEEKVEVSRLVPRTCAHRGGFPR